MNRSTPLDTFLHACRRRKKHWLGSGPWHCRPVNDILVSRHPIGALHLADTTDGEILTIAEPSMPAPTSHSLLGQSHPSFPTDSGEPRFRDTGVFPAHTTRFWSLESAGVLGSDGLVYCPRCRAAVSETARTIFRAAAFHPELGYTRPVSLRLAGVSLLLAGPFGQAHHHLLWDYLAKLALFPESLRLSVDHYLLGAAETPNTIDWLRTAQVPLKKVIWLEGASHILCDQIIFSMLPCEGGLPRPATLAGLRRLMTAPTPSDRRRWLWISRSGLPKRNLVWEDRILAKFPRFERLDLGALSARQQIDAFASASVIAGPHGSGMANLAFVQGAGDLFEFFPEDHRGDRIFSRIAHVAGWRHSWARVNFTQPDDLAAVVAALEARLPAE